MSLQKNPKILKDRDLAERFGRLILKYMTRHGLSDDALVGRLRAASNGMKGSLSRVAPYKQGTGGNPTPQTISIYQKALEIPQDEIDQLFSSDSQPQTGLPSAAQLSEQHEQLMEFLSRQTNLPNEVKRDRLAAQDAIVAGDIAKARIHLQSVSDTTRRSAAHEVEEYARSLAAQGALALTELEYSDARRHYGEAIAFPNLSVERKARYRRYYLIASNAVIAKSKNLDDGPTVYAEIIAAGVKPDVFTFSTLINISPDYAAAKGWYDAMVKAEVEPNVITFNTLVNISPDYAAAKGWDDAMVKAEVEPNVITFNTLVNISPDYAAAKGWYDAMVKAEVEPNEITTVALASKTFSFAEAMALTAELRADGAFRGAGYYSAVMSKVRTDDDPVAVIGWYFDQDYRHVKSLEPPLKMYASKGRHREAMEFVVRWPQLDASSRYFRLNGHDFEREIEYFLADELLRPSALYAAGIHHFNKGEFPTARDYFDRALQFDTHPSRKAHIDAIIVRMAA